MSPSTSNSGSSSSSSSSSNLSSNSRSISASKSKAQLINGSVTRCYCFTCTKNDEDPNGKLVVVKTWKIHRAQDLRTLKEWYALHRSMPPPSLERARTSRYTIINHPSTSGPLAADGPSGDANQPVLDLDVFMADDFELPMDTQGGYDGLRSSGSNTPRASSPALHGLQRGASDYDGSDGEQLVGGRTSRTLEGGLQQEESGAEQEDPADVDGASYGGPDDADADADEDDNLLREEQGFSYDGHDEADSGDEADEDDRDPDRDPEEQPDPLGLFGDDLLEALLGSYQLGPRPTEPLVPPRLSAMQELSLRHYRRWLRTHGTEEAYKEHAATLEEVGHKVMSLHKVKKLVARITNLNPRPVDMCVNSCIAYVGEYEHDTVCTFKRKHKDDNGVLRTVICGEPRKGKNGKPRRQYWVLSILDRLRALYRNPTMSKLMLHRHERLQDLLRAQQSGDWSSHRFVDSVDGLRNLRLHGRGILQESRDVAITIATDGAQLLANKKDSSAWMITASCLNAPPDLRFKRPHQFVLATIPGPNGPGDIESFFRPIAQELAELSVGAWAWDAAEEEWFVLRAVLVGLYADQPGSSKLNKMTGTQGRTGCRFCIMAACYGCPVPAVAETGDSAPAPAEDDASTTGQGQGKGKGKKNAKKTAYFPATTPLSLRSEPLNQHRPSVYDLDNLPLRTHALFEEHIAELDACATKTARDKISRKNGVMGPPLLSFSEGFTHPDFFPLDVFHLFSCNTFGLLWTTFRDPKPGDPAVLDAAHRSAFGKAVKAAALDLPGAFGDPPRDPHLYYNTRYKMHELISVFHRYLGPYLHHIGIPSPVLDMLVTLLDAMSPAVQEGGCTFEDIRRINADFQQFVRTWEDLFIRHEAVLLSRARISIHMLLHVGKMISTLGSVLACSQAACERTIGSIKNELRAHKDMYSTIKVRTHLVEQYHAVEMIVDAEDNGLAEHRQPTEQAARIKPGESVRSKVLDDERRTWPELFEFLGDNDLQPQRGTVTLHRASHFRTASASFRVRGIIGEDETTRRRSSRVAYRADGDSGYCFMEVEAFVLRLAVDDDDEDDFLAVGRLLQPDHSPGAITSHWIAGRWSEERALVDASRIVDLVGAFNIEGSDLTYLFPRKNALGGYTQWWAREVSANSQ